MKGFLNSVVVNYSWFFLAAGCLTAIALLAWWLIRRRLRDFWLPVIRVFVLPVSRLPRIILQRPPLAPFILFMLCALAFVVWSLNPSTKVPVEDEPEMRRVHVFIDLSPSVSAQISMEELSERVVKLFDENSPKSRVSFGTSHGDNIYEVTGASSARGIIKGLSFHRGGVKIGSAVRAQLTRVGEVDQLFVVSDRDQHSWLGFQWQYLTVDGEVHHVDLDDQRRRLTKPNVFIQDARYLSSSGSLNMDWDVEVSLGTLISPVSGTLTATVDGEIVGVENWEIQAGRRSTVVSLSWPQSKIPSNSEAKHLEWMIEVSGGDLLQMDNRFLSPLKGRRDLVVLVGEPSGELRLEDPLVALETAFRVSGYKVSRFDRWPLVNGVGDLESFESAGVLVLMGGENTNQDLWCPKTLVQASGRVKAGPIWVAPRSLTESFQAVCKCVATLNSKITADMCQNQISRNEWIQILSGVGGKQIGGDIGEASGGMAMMLPASAEMRDVVSFFVPIRPAPEIGLSWGVFPILVRDLMFFSAGRSFLGGSDDGSNQDAWPRIADVSRVNLADQIDDDNLSQSLRMTNVPVGESLIAVMSSGDLPSSWSAPISVGDIVRRAGKEEEDSRVWVGVLCAMVVLMMLFEVVWQWLLIRRKKLASSLVVLLLSTVIFNAESARARAQLSVLGSDTGQSQLTFAALAREVAARTSLELSARSLVFSSFDERAETSPWIWTSKASLLANKSGTISDAGRLWLKRGGIFIFDSPQPSGVLERLLEPLMVGTVKPSGWMAVPPDHELMRSFYLLNSLPTCKGRFWRVFSFDGRVAAIESPYSNLKVLQDKSVPVTCENAISYEQHVRIFVNLMMTAFTTDYKRDQIHLPEILKRLRVP